MEDVKATPDPRWVPSHLVDEVTPPSRPSPDDWLADRKPVEGACVLAGWDDDPEGESRRQYEIGDVVKFSALYSYPSVRVRVFADGTWAADDPIPAEAESFWEPDAEILADSLGELVSQFCEDDVRTETQVLVVRAYTWTEPQAFVLQLSDSGEATFERCAS